VIARLAVCGSLVMTRTDVELIVRSVMREYGIRVDIRRIALFGREWKIEVVTIDGERKTLSVFDSSPQNLRWSVMAALGLEME
jgi:hypothetical protein